MNLVTILIAVLAAMGPLSTDVYLPGLPAMAIELQSSVSQMQLSMTTAFLGLALGQIVIGPWSDQVGRKMPVITSMIGFAVASLGCSMATSLESLLMWRFIQGFCGTGGIVLSRAMAGDMYRGQDLTKFMALLMLINSVVPIGGPVLGGIIISLYDWQKVFDLLTLVGIGLAVVSLWKLPETLAVDHRVTGGIVTSLQSMGALWQQKAFRGYLLAQGFASMALFGYISSSPFILQDMYGLSSLMYSVCFGIGSATLGVVAQISARINKRYDVRTQLLFGIKLGLVVGVLLMVAAMVKPVQSIYMIVLLILITASCGFTLPMSFVGAMNVQTGNAGSASGLLGVVSFLAGAIASPLVGLGGSSTIWPLALVIFGAHVLSFLFMHLYVSRVEIR